MQCSVCFNDVVWEAECEDGERTGHEYLFCHNCDGLYLDWRMTVGCVLLPLSYAWQNTLEDVRKEITPDIPLSVILLAEEDEPFRRALSTDEKCVLVNRAGSAGVDDERGIMRIIYQKFAQRHITLMVLNDAPPPVQWFMQRLHRANEGPFFAAGYVMDGTLIHLD